jgi:cytidylate kinase
VYKLEQEVQIMNQDAETINRMRAITISREYGSGGGEIATRLSRHLGWRLLDHEIVERVALEMGTSIEQAEAHDERTEGFLARAFNNLQFLEPAYLAGASSDAFLANEETYLGTVRRIVSAAVAQGHVVIVGRGSQVLLAEQRDILHVRIIAPFEKCVAYVMQREGIDRAAAESRIKMKDHDRMKHLETAFHRKSDDAHLYDIVLNTSFLNLDSAVEIISHTLQQKAGQLSVKTGELGPAAGVQPYPDKPEDFRPKAG